MFAAAHADADAFSQCWSDLIIIALFFCLRSCEYTKTNSHRRTTQFRFRDIQFHDDDGVIPTQAPAKVFMAATAVTLYLDTQKNCVRGESCTMEATGLPHGDPVTAAARIIIALFFCLRSCKYTKTNSHRRTTQFRFRDIQFHDDDGVIPTQAPAKVFLAETAVTLYLETQKNCVRGESFTMAAAVTGSPCGSPVASIVQDSPRTQFFCVSR